MKRILLVAPDLSVGGVQRALVTFLRAAPFDRLDITLLLFRDGGEFLDEVPSQVHVKVEKRAGKRERLRSAVSGMLNRLRLNSIFKLAKQVYHRSGQRLARMKCDGRFDIAIAFSDGLATWYVANSVQAGRKIAFVHTDVSRAGYDAGREREIYRQFEEVVLSSRASEESFLRLIPQMGGKTVILPNAVDRERVLSLSEGPSPYPEDSGAVRLLTVGRLSHEKGVGKIPVLLRKLLDAGQSVCWYVVGDGPERENLLRSARRLKVEKALVLAGQLENPFLYMRYCDIYVQPSEYEGYCIALAEARALCRPIVACNFAGASEQLENGVDGAITGMDADEVFPALLALVSQSKKRDEFRAALSQRQDSAENAAMARWWERL